MSLPDTRLDGLLGGLREALGDAAVLTGPQAAPWSRDWAGQYRWTPLCAVRPACTAEVSAVLRLAQEAGTPVVPVGGNTGLAGGTTGEGAIMLSLDRMARIREIRTDARVAVVEAGVILSDLHDAAEAEGLSFPMTFGARGSARLGGILSTNAGGSNVLRYGNTRDLVLGLEAVLADGRVVDLMSALHKDNSGYSLKHLLIGAEGTLGVITAATLKLVPKPRAYATAMVALETMEDALTLLNHLQEATGGLVEAFEYMSRVHLEAYARHAPDARPVFEAMHPVTVLVEVGATAARDVIPGADGQVPLGGYLETVLTGLLEDGILRDAVIAQSDAQRAEMWARREAAAELALARLPLINNDIAVPLDQVGRFLAVMDDRLRQVDPEALAIVVSHLGDGNIHYAVWPGEGREAPDHIDAIMEAVEDEVLKLGGSFSAEHGIGVSKRPSMARRKDPVALDMMRAIKQALDPRDILNPGKLLPEPD